MFGPPIDISRPLRSGMLVWPGDPPVRVTPLFQIGPHSVSNVTRLQLTTHTGSHLDVPLHFFENGRALADFPLTRFISDARVIHAAGDAIQPAHVPDDRALRGKSLLFKTRNSQLYEKPEFDEEFVYLTPDAARKCIGLGINLVGIDYLSVDKFDDPRCPCHYLLLGNGVLILEGICLASVEPGDYILLALPLNIEKADGAPVRAVLMPKPDDAA